MFDDFFGKSNRRQSPNQRALIPRDFDDMFNMPVPDIFDRMMDNMHHQMSKLHRQMQTFHQEIDRQFSHGSQGAFFQQKQTESNGIRNRMQQGVKKEVRHGPNNEFMSYHAEFRTMSTNSLDSTPFDGRIGNFQNQKGYLRRLGDDPVDINSRPFPRPELDRPRQEALALPRNRRDIQPAIPNLRTQAPVPAPAPLRQRAARNPARRTPAQGA